MVAVDMMAPRPTPRPPEPVDVTNEQWIARAWQWVFDQLTHLDSCTDETKQQVTELRADLFASVAAGKLSDETVMKKLEEHEAEHKALDDIKRGRQSIWRLEGALAKTLFNVVTDGAVLTGIVLVLKVLGVLG